MKYCLQFNIYKHDDGAEHCGFAWQI